MPLRMKIIIAGCALYAAHEIGGRSYRKHLRNLIDVYKMFEEENESLKAKCRYMIHLLEENHAELDEFDLIVLTHDIEA